MFPWSATNLARGVFPVDQEGSHSYRKSGRSPDSQKKTKVMTATVLAITTAATAPKHDA
jgi:hypothetical protein